MCDFIVSLKFRILSHCFFKNFFAIPYFGDSSIHVLDQLKISCNPLLLCFTTPIFSLWIVFIAVFSNFLIFLWKWLIYWESYLMQFSSKTLQFQSLETQFGHFTFSSISPTFFNMSTSVNSYICEFWLGFK